MSHRIPHLYHHLTHLNVPALRESLSQCAEESGKRKLPLLADMSRCAVRYGAGFRDYALFRFYELSPAQRATYVTRGINEKLNAALNDKAHCRIFDDKALFYARYFDLLRRRWLKLEDCTLSRFSGFMNGLSQIVLKPRKGSCGTGIRLLRATDFSSIREMYHFVQDSGAELAEEAVVQHPVMAKLFSGSVNTIRVGTLRAGDTVHLLYAFLRMGNSGEPVDNLNAGGLFAPVDIQTGIVTHPGCDKAHGVYCAHPKSGCPIPGFQIPCWKEIRSLCTLAALRSEGMRYVGWDVAVTEDGPLLIEGNNLPGFDILQLPAHLPADKTGILPRFRELLPELNL